MSNVSARTQKQLSAHLQHLAIEAELATNKRRRAIAEKRFRDANRPLSIGCVSLGSSCQSNGGSIVTTKSPSLASAGYGSSWFRVNTRM